MMITDLDGTLAGTGGIISEAARACLEELGASGVTRAIATGRSLFGARKLLADCFPIDYLIFSSGAGILDWKTKTLLREHHLDAEEIAAALTVLGRHRLDFMLHDPVPENHSFAYHVHSAPPADFTRRCEKHAAVCRRWKGEKMARASQFLVIHEQSHGSTWLERLKGELPGFNIIRATSPLDGASVWLEIFSDRVSKSLASAWLAEKLCIAPKQILAVGNDYNDIDLLEWAGMPVLVGNCPPDLRARFQNVATNDENGFCEAVRSWELKR